MKWINTRYLILSLGVTCQIMFSSIAGAQVMQSDIYKIQSDSINSGGSSSSSTLYSLDDTVGELGTGESNSASFSMHAGFWQMQESFLAISTPSDLALNSISGIGSSASEGVVTWTVLTDNRAGYSLTIQSTTTPSLQSPEDFFVDYTPTSSNPDYVFSIPQSTSAFGYSPEGNDVVSRFKDNGSVCGAGSLETASKCWDGLSVTPKSIVSSPSANHPVGTNTTVRFRAENGINHIQKAGAYSAEIIITATAL